MLRAKKLGEFKFRVAGYQIDVLDEKSDLLLDVGLSVTLALADMGHFVALLQVPLWRLHSTEVSREDWGAGELFSPIVLDVAGCQREKRWNVRHLLLN